MGDIPRADPASTPRIQAGGTATRERTIFRHRAHGCEVDVTPIDGGRRFEVRAEYDGPQLPAFAIVADELARRVESHMVGSAELAIAIARRVVDQLRAPAAERNIFLPRIEHEVTGKNPPGGAAGPLPGLTGA